MCPSGTPDERRCGARTTLTRCARPTDAALDGDGPGLAGWLPRRGARRGAREPCSSASNSPADVDAPEASGSPWCPAKLDQTGTAQGDFGGGKRRTPQPELRPLALLGVDPDLARGLTRDQFALAEARLRVPRVVVDIGHWRVAAGAPPEAFGLLIVSGILKRTLAVAHLPCTELLSAGDIVRPVATVDDSERSRGRPEWFALERTELAVLDEPFVDACRDSPLIISTIVARVVERGHWRTSIRSAIAQTRRTDDRLALLFWHFSQRWGRVRPDGVWVELPVTHETLAQLVGATRPAVTTALARLVRRTALSRPRENVWVLHGEPPSFAAPS